MGLPFALKNGNLEGEPAAFTRDDDHGRAADWRIGDQADQVGGIDDVLPVER